MNIFVVDPCPIVCAKALDDKRIAKMAGETQYMLRIPSRIEAGEEKIGYLNHGCSIWTRQTQSNYRWMIEHLKALCEEHRVRYEHRTGKSIKSQEEIPFFEEYIEKIPTGDRTPFANHSLFQREDWDVFKCYQVTMLVKWYTTDKRGCSWSNRPEPWFIKKLLFSNITL